ncbi:MAG: amidohydrolase [Blastopirellula sp.]|nr:MAG: amidohydrolase [Blastopirellula sp.]
MIVAGGKIKEIGPASKIKVPKDAKTIDLKGRVIIPGLVDSHSHIGVAGRAGGDSDTNEGTGPVQAIVRALDSINPFDPSIRMATAGGITTANIMPGSANVIGGQTLYLKLHGHSVDSMFLGTPDNLGGLKMANGENPKRSYGSRGQAPATRMKIASLQRSEYIKAQEYKRKWDEYREKLSKAEEAIPPAIDLGMEPLVEVLEHRRTVHFHTHRADDILTVLRLKKEFGFDLVIQHGTETYKVLKEVAAAGVPVSLTIVDSPGGKAEVVDWLDEAGAIMHKAGIKVLVNTDDPVTESRFFLRTAATAVRGGLPEDEALKAVTLYSAEAMKLDHRIGSLEKGKDADFVVLSGAPFSVYTLVLQTYIEGRKVFDTNKPLDRSYQTGGFRLAGSGEPLPKAKPIAHNPINVKAPALPGNAKSRKSKTSTKDLVVLAGRVYPVSSDPIDDGVVHVQDGKIVHVGPRKGFKIPPKAKVVSAAVVTPGLIDAYSVVPLNGIYNIPADQDANETSGVVQSDLRVLDGFNPNEPLLRYLLQNGVTVIHACPGQRNVIAGQSGVFRTYGHAADSMVIRFPQAMVFNLGNSSKGKGSRTNTRMGVVATIREKLTAAVNYQREQAEKDENEGTKIDLAKDPLVAMLNQEMKALFVAHQANDIQTAMRLIDDYKLDGQLGMGTEAFRIIDQVKQAKLPILLHPTMQKSMSMEKANTFTGQAAFLASKNVPFAFCSSYEGYVPKTRVIRFEAAMAAAHGLGFKQALQAMTLDAAKILEIDEHYGSLEVNKTADLVLYNGDPLEHATLTTHVIVDGKVVFDRSAAPLVPLMQRLYWNTSESGCCLSF